MTDGQQVFGQCRKKQGKDPLLWRGQRHTSHARTLGASCYFTWVSAQLLLPAPGPASSPCGPAPRAQNTVSDKVKPQQQCFPKALPPILLKHRTAHVLYADLEKCKITQRLPQARSFCILGKKTSMTRKTAQDPWKRKNIRKKQSTPQNRITDKPGKLGMSKNV